MPYKPLLCFIGLFILFCSCERSVEVKREKISGIELAYYTRGTGEPLIMIMGFKGTMGEWDPALLETLEKKYTLILFDNRGAGLSSDSVENHTSISQMADDTVQLIKSLGYSKAHILGWSMGSRIAMAIAMKYPESVDTLILSSPNPGGSHIAKRTTDDFKRLTKAESKEEILSLLFPDSEEGKLAASELNKRLKVAVMDGESPNDFEIPPRTVERQKQAMENWDQNNEIFDELAKINRPTLVTGGLADRIDPIENVRIVASQIPYAWAAYFPFAGHYFISQDYINFSELLFAFTEAHKQKSENQLNK
ncbi:alpha/beta fold hydrolase [Criblamydia sequanensis]|uniref:Alpha/beta hydrolase n=1 Tax=Candidatus Criblamydia sequanensis CRIB-18 TaxID=1437425 RepID=A0A090D374_9BACT|nr:alpha/beta hydrolase [Criblamydia sequanensis]CDR35235.1 Putative alpha/beta hydrolase [Criblamydia sequanensis CRIB-18]